MAGPSTRRTFLAALGASAGAVAGCTGRGGGAPAGETTSPAGAELSDRAVFLGEGVSLDLPDGAEQVETLDAHPDLAVFPVRTETTDLGDGTESVSASAPPAAHDALAAGTVTALVGDYAPQGLWSLLDDGPYRYGVPEGEDDVRVAAVTPRGGTADTHLHAVADDTAGTLRALDRTVGYFRPSCDAHGTGDWTPAGRSQFTVDHAMGTARRWVEVATREGAGRRDVAVTGTVEADGAGSAEPTEAATTLDFGNGVELRQAWPRTSDPVGPEVTLAQTPADERVTQTFTAGDERPFEWCFGYRLSAPKEETKLRWSSDVTWSWRRPRWFGIMEETEQYETYGTTNWFL